MRKWDETPPPPLGGRSPRSAPKADPDAHEAKRARSLAPRLRAALKGRSRPGTADKPRD